VYEYRAELVRIIDSDTVDIKVDLGLDITHEIQVRLMGINAPALNTAAGQRAKTYLERILPAGTPMHCQTVEDKTAKCGRYRADLTIITASGELSPSTVSATMLAARQAVPHTGGTYESTPVFDSLLDKTPGSSALAQARRHDRTSAEAHAKLQRLGESVCVQIPGSTSASAAPRRDDLRARAVRGGLRLDRDRQRRRCVATDCRREVSICREHLSGSVGATRRSQPDLSSVPRRRPDPR